ncbi:MAG: hypothetical protein ABW170_02555 [Candidatus Thiodiazotropha sp. L084R]
MTRTAGALIGRRRSSAFWGLGCPKTHHEIKDSLAISMCRCRFASALNDLESTGTRIPSSFIWRRRPSEIEAWISSPLNTFMTLPCRLAAATLLAPRLKNSNRIVREFLIIRMRFI